MSEYDEFAKWCLECGSAVGHSTFCRSHEDAPYSGEDLTELGRLHLLCDRMAEYLGGGGRNIWDVFLPAIEAAERREARRD